MIVGGGEGAGRTWGGGGGGGRKLGGADGTLLCAFGVCGLMCVFCT